MLKLRLASKAHCDLCIPKRLKEKFYKIAIRPTMTYEAECWPTRKEHMQNTNVAKMRMWD